MGYGFFLGFKAVKAPQRKVRATFVFSLFLQRPPWLPVASWEVAKSQNLSVFLLSQKAAETKSGGFILLFSPLFLSSPLCFSALLKEGKTTAQFY